MKQFIAIGAVIALAGCAGTPVNKYTPADLPQANISGEVITSSSLEAVVTATAQCGSNCKIRGDWAEGVFTVTQGEEKNIQVGSPQKITIPIRAGVKGKTRVVLTNDAGRVHFEKEVEISQSQTSTQTRTQSSIFQGFTPRRDAPTVFRSEKQCSQAAFAGAFDYYVPTKDARRPVAKADGKARTLGKLEGFYCLEMDTTMGKLWIVAEKGKDDYIWQDGRIDGNAKCLNRVYNSVPLIPPDAPIETRPSKTAKIDQGEWTRETFLSQEKVSSINWGWVILAGAVVCIVGKVWICEPDKPNPTNIPGGPGVTTLPAGPGVGP